MSNEFINITMVLGSKGVNATGLIRSLGREGIPVVYASNNSRIESKYVFDYLRLPNKKEDWVGCLVEYVRGQLEKIVIFPTDDETALWIDDNYEILQKDFIVPNAKGKLKTFADKTVMNELARKVGLDVPDFMKISLNEFNKDIRYPVILKPYAGYAGDKGDIEICRNKIDYADAVDKLQEQGYKEMLLQQLLDEPNQEEIGLMGMVLPNGEVVIPGIIHKIRSYPVGRGSTSYARFTPDISDVDMKKIKQFVAVTGYTGLFDIEMIKARGKYWFIEINYRNGQYGYTPTVAGYNLPSNWYRGMLGQNIQLVDNLKEIYYINERDDFKHVKHGEISLYTWLKQFRGATAYGMFCPEDQRPYIRQYMKIPDRIVIKYNRWKNLLRDLLIKEEWNIAIREKDTTPLWKDGGVDKPFEVLPNTIRYWAADPFIISNENQDYLFFEMYDRFKGKGVIGYRIIENGRVGKMKVAYEATTHLSFPFVFKYNGDIYMLPENAKGKELVLLKATNFPQEWEIAQKWLAGKSVCDSVLFRLGKDVFMFTQEFEKDYKLDCLNAYIYDNGVWRPCDNNLIVQDISNARMAGDIIFEENKVIRVAQNCQGTYGKGIKFNYLKFLSSEEYREECFNEILASDINIKRGKHNYQGIHTYNQNQRYEVIDLKCRNVIKIGNVINIGYRVIQKCKIGKK